MDRKNRRRFSLADVLGPFLGILTNLALGKLRHAMHFRADSLSPPPGEEFAPFFISAF